MFIKVTTEGDCEGRSTKTIGIFKCNTEKQVAQFLINENIKPYYNFQFIQVRDPVVDVTTVQVDPKLTISKDFYNRVSFLNKEELKNPDKVWGSLSEEDKRLILGL